MSPVTVEATRVVVPWVRWVWMPLRMSSAVPEVKEAPPPPWLWRSTKPGTSQWPVTSMTWVFSGARSVIRVPDGCVATVGDSVGIFLDAGCGHGAGRGGLSPARRSRNVRDPRQRAAGSVCRCRAVPACPWGVPSGVTSVGSVVVCRRSQASRPAPRQPAVSPRAAGTMVGSFWKVTRWRTAVPQRCEQGVARLRQAATDDQGARVQQGEGGDAGRRRGRRRRPARPAALGSPDSTALAQSAASAPGSRRPRPTPR